MAQWLTPTGHIDYSAGWISETLAYNNYLLNYAWYTVDHGKWTTFLGLTHAPMACSKVRFYASGETADFTSIDIDVYYSGAWHHVYEGSYTHSTWIEKSIGSTQIITVFRFRFYNNSGDEWLDAYLHDVDFYGDTVVKPTITTQSCTNITTNSATGNGNITDTGYENATTRGFCYMEGTSGDPTTANSKVYDTGSFGTGAFSKGISGLSPGTGYRVRAYAINSAGTGYGATVQLTTNSGPTIITNEVTGIERVNPAEVNANGNITSIGSSAVTRRGFKYGLTETDTWDVNEDGSFGTGIYSLGITGLDPDTIYYVRAYATNSDGTSYGAYVQFKTAIPPVATTQNVIDIIRVDPSKVTANGLIEYTETGNITKRGFKYGLTETDTWDKYEEDNFDEGSFSLQITGLNPDIIYYIRAYATGVWGTVFGSYIQFKTAVPYWSQKTEIKAEATASDEDIAKVGGKRTLTINNHLIQNMSIAQNIANAYLADYKDQKTKLIITKPCPPPYEIGDTITRGEEGIPYAPAASAVISYAPANSAEHPYRLTGHDMLIRKLNISFSAGNYTSVIELEN